MPPLNKASSKIGKSWAGDFTRTALVGVLGQRGGQAAFNQADQWTRRREQEVRQARQTVDNKVADARQSVNQAGRTLQRQAGAAADTGRRAIDQGLRGARTTVDRVGRAADREVQQAVQGGRGLLREGREAVDQGVDSARATGSRVVRSAEQGVQRAVKGGQAAVNQGLLALDNGVDATKRGAADAWTVFKGVDPADPTQSYRFGAQQVDPLSTPELERLRGQQAHVQAVGYDVVGRDALMNGLALGIGGAVAVPMLAAAAATPAGIATTKALSRAGQAMWAARADAVRNGLIDASTSAITEAGKQTATGWHDPWAVGREAFKGGVTGTVGSAFGAGAPAALGDGAAPLLRKAIGAVAEPLGGFVSGVAVDRAAGDHDLPGSLRDNALSAATSQAAKFLPLPREGHLGGWMPFPRAGLIGDVGRSFWANAADRVIGLDQEDLTPRPSTAAPMAPGIARQVRRR
jgi:hypothetical protein